MSEQLDQFFEDEVTLYYLRDSRTRLTHLLKNVVSFEQLRQSIREETRLMTLRTGKDNNRALGFLGLAQSFDQIGKALLNMSLEKEPVHFVESVPYICLKIALKLQRSGKYLPALNSINQAIELAGDNKHRDYFPMLAPLKIDLQIKLQLFNEARQTLQVLMQSMTDSGHANRLLDNYRMILLKHTSEPAPEIILPLESEQEESDLLELDQNCFIETSPLKGRHMKCSGSIPYGAYLLRERALSLVYYPRFLQNRCTFCHQSIENFFYPCRQCNQVVFCNSKCERLSFCRGIHRYECGMIDFVKQNCIAWHTYRLVSVIGLESVAQFYHEKNELNRKEFTIEDFLKEERLCKNPFEEMSKEDQMRVFAIIDSFVDHQKAEDTVTERETLRWAVKIVILINQQQHYFDNMETNCSLLNDFFVVVQSVAILMRKLLFNAFGWTEIDPVDMNTNHLIANCVCLVSSFINHSCDSNCYWDIGQAVIAISAVSTIEPNHEITISYGQNEFDDFRQRHHRLADYKFICACVSCLRDVLKLFCLSCTNCKGPVFPHEPIEETEAPTKCMLCGQPYEHYRAVMTSAIRDRLRLLFLCRYENQELNKDQCVQKVRQLINDLLARVHVQSQPLQQCITAACNFLAHKGMVEDAVRVGADWLDTIDLEHSWRYDLLKGVLLLVRWLQLETSAKSRSELQHDYHGSVSDRVRRALQLLWKDFLKSAKSNQSLYLIIEFVENSAFVQ